TKCRACRPVPRCWLWHGAHALLGASVLLLRRTGPIKQRYALSGRHRIRSYPRNAGSRRSGGELVRCRFAWIRDRTCVKPGCVIAKSELRLAPRRHRGGGDTEIKRAVALFAWTRMERLQAWLSHLSFHR